MLFGGLSRLHCGSRLSETQIERGTLFSSGLVAGEGLLGLGLAVLAVAGLDISLSPEGTPLGGWAGLLAFALLGFLLIRVARRGV